MWAVSTAWRSWVLAVGGAEAQASEDVNQAARESVAVRLDAASSPASRMIASTSRWGLFDLLLDARGVDPSVGDEAGEREAADFAADGVEA